MILDTNENFQELFGYHREEMLGKHVSMFVDEATRQTPEFKTKFNQTWSDLRKGKACTCEQKRATKDGKEIRIEYSYNPVLDPDGKPYKVVGVIRNVTDQKLVNADSRGQIAAIRKAQAVGEFSLDGTVLTANDHWLQSLGYSLDEVKGNDHGTFVAESFRQSPDYADFWAKLRQGEHQAGEYKRIGP